MLNCAVLAGTKAESEPAAEVGNVSPACINTFVVRWLAAYFCRTKSFKLILPHSISFSLINGCCASLAREIL